MKTVIAGPILASPPRQPFSPKPVPGSSLQRTILVMNDPTCPIEIQNLDVRIRAGEPGTPQARGAGLEQILTLKANHPVTVYTGKYLYFDVLNHMMQSTAFKEVHDINTGEVHPLDRVDWDPGKVLTQLRDWLTTVVYIEEVRTNDGHVWSYNQNLIEGELDRRGFKDYR